MARYSTLQGKLNQIKRKYKSVNEFRFFYNDKRELNKRYSRILVWFLIHDIDRGHSIFPIEFKRKVSFNPTQWRDFFSTGADKYEPLFKIFTQSILPAINNKSGSAWRFKSVIGWTGLNAPRPNKNPDTHTKRNKPAKKRNANVR